MAQINKPTDYFNTVLYTGNGSTQSITGVGFQPDWIWGKNRSGANAHWVNDVIRGVDIRLIPNETGAEDNPSTDIVTSFDSDGFSLGSNTEGNANTNNYVSWNWKANGSGSSNTDGSITSTVSANTTAGFSIVSYTGTGSNATVGHGLGVAPSVIIIKHREKGTGYNWVVYHHKNTSAPETDFLKLNLTDATADDNTMFNDTAPTSSVFSIGTAGLTNNNTFNFIAYCFAEKKGYSKFGSYTGNGSTDGTFVYTGFKPAFVLLKRTDTGGNPWLLNDNKRDTFNFCRKNLFPDTSGAEVDVTGEGGTIDILSQGFKLRSLGTTLNGSGSTYIYMCFAENPLVGTNNIPATAR